MNAETIPVNAIADNGSMDLTTEIEAELSAKQNAPGDMLPANTTSIESLETFNSNLPETVCLLYIDHRVTVYLVGTAHFSKESQDDVRKTIRLSKPSDVVVELCSSRKHVMLQSANNAHGDSPARQPDPLSYKNIKLNIERHRSTMVGLLNSLLVFVSMKIQEKTGLVPGGEFKAAFEESQLLVPAPRLHLGDRNVLVTLQRAWYSLSSLKRLRLLYALFTSDVNITAEDIEKCKGADVLEQLMKELEQDFPELSRVIIAERDLYLSSVIKQIASQCEPDSRVVAVVGIGHMRGIRDNWENAENVDLKQLCIIPRTKSRIPWKSMFKLSCAFGAFYVGYRYLR